MRRFLHLLGMRRYRLRILLRMAFLLLAVATLGLALSVLQQEKQLSYQNYAAGFHKSAQHIVATLRHPTGQLALLNPPRGAPSATVLHPVLLPFGSLDFDDRNKVQQAIAFGYPARDVVPTVEGKPLKDVLAALGRKPINELLHTETWHGAAPDP